MTKDLDFAAAHNFILQTYNYYGSLMQGAPAIDPRSPESRSPGGQLFWVGELDEAGRAMTVAGNVAGTASLAATSEVNAQRQAVRDGIVDFLVNSLDEALRILKNEIRKGQTVAVCVAAAFESVEREMVERGVRPDVFREGILRTAVRNVAHEKSRDLESDPMSVRTLVVWRVDRAPALWLPKMDAVALECLEPQEAIARRWLQRSSRYLGRIAQAEHLVWSNREFAARMMERVSAMAERNELKVPGRVEATWSGVCNDQLFFGLADEHGTVHQP